MPVFYSLRIPGLGAATTAALLLAPLQVSPLMGSLPQCPLGQSGHLLLSSPAALSLWSPWDHEPQGDMSPRGTDMSHNPCRVWGLARGWLARSRCLNICGTLPGSMCHARPGQVRPSSCLP